MEAPLVVAILWLIFFGTHVGLATRHVRGVLVDRLGANGFFVLYSFIAAGSFAVLVAYYATHRFDGPGGLALGTTEVGRWLLMGAVMLGVVLIGAGLMVYPRTPVALFGQPIVEPRGIEKITRHPFFVGAAILGLAHALLATKLVGAIFMGGFALLGIVGARHQDVKHLGLRGAPYGRYMEATSLMPFAALMAGRQRLTAADLPIATLLGGVAVTVGLRLVHTEIFAHGGAWVIGVLFAGASLATFQAWRRKRRYVARGAVGAGGGV